MSKGYDRFYKKYSDLIKQWDDFVDRYREDKAKIDEGIIITEYFKYLQDELDFRPRFSEFDGKEEYLALLNKIKYEADYMRRSFEEIKSGKGFKMDNARRTKIPMNKINNSKNNYSGTVGNIRYYDEDYEAERRARLDMYEDASDITDESDYWDYIGGDY